jgi:hypothetical protein
VTALFVYSRDEASTGARRLFTHIGDAWTTVVLLQLCPLALLATAENACNSVWTARSLKHAIWHVHPVSAAEFCLMMTSKVSKKRSRLDAPEGTKDDEPFPRGGGSILTPLEERKLKLRAKADFERETFIGTGSGKSKRSKSSKRSAEDEVLAATAMSYRIASQKKCEHRRALTLCYRSACVTITRYTRDLHRGEWLVSGASLAGLQAGICQGQYAQIR